MPEELKGLVSEITRFSTKDGPGIRTTVFLKGCYLRCRWCSNPETFVPERMLYYIPARCHGCGRCIEACPRHAISDDFGSTSRVDRGLCDRCFKCADTCLYRAFTVSGTEYTVDELVHILERDRPFYGKEGGLTVSGGEPMFQGRFLKALLHESKARGFNNVLDTCGQGDTGLLREILPDVDMALLDLKVMDPDEHERWTGMRNDRILENAEIITGTVRTRVSVPLIPGVNDSRENIEATASFAASHGVEAIDINPFHKLGAGKYGYLGLESPYDQFGELPEGRVAEVVGIFESHGLPVTVGRMM